MKNKVVIAIAAIIILAMAVSFKAPLYAQEGAKDTTREITSGPKESPNEEPKEGSQESKKEGLKGQPHNFTSEQLHEHMSRALGLSEEQKTQIKPFLEDRMTKTKEVENDASLSPEQKKEKAKEIREATDEKIKLVLTDKQRERLEESKRIRQKMGIQR